MKPYRLGLTGSIGMGKSTTAAMFAEAGIPVWDADAAVHRLYAPGGAGAAAMAAAFGDVLQDDGAVSRAALKALILGDPTRMKQIEEIIHPLVAQDRAGFLAGATSDILVLDIPLLFETRLADDCDATLLVTAPPDVQRARVMARPGITKQQFEFLLERQMPDRDKRRLADHIVETLSIDSTRAYVRALIAHIRARPQKGRDA